MIQTIARTIKPSEQIQVHWARALTPPALPAYGIVLTMALFIAVSVLFSSFRYDAAYFSGPIISLLLIGGIGMLTRALGYERAGSGIEAIAIFSAISLAAPLCAVILASNNMPLVDQLLVQLDRQLFFGFNRTDFAHWVASRESLFAITKWVYHSLIGQPSLLIGLLFTTGMIGRGWRLLFAWGLTLGVIVVISPLTPALGSPPYFLDFETTFHGARDGSLRVIGREALTGIITFPSFHAAAAILLGWGFAPIRYLGPIMIGLNILMWLSAIVAGHYLVDLVAGSVIAVGALWAANMIIARVEDPGPKRATS